jgi:uncharacterized SAM-binding protein YcdF (DUF218 family)
MRMGKPHQVGRIEVEEDLGFLRREWRWQRIAWIVFALIILAALVGAFGRGPFSKGRVGETARFAVEYQRVLRHGAQDELIVHIGPDLPTDTLIRLSVSQQYLIDQQFEFVAPEPTQQTVQDQVVVFEFKRAGPRSALRLAAHVRPTGYGRVRARLELQGAPPLTINQFILP